VLKRIRVQIKFNKKIQDCLTSLNLLVTKNFAKTLLQCKKLTNNSIRPTTEFNKNVVTIFNIHTKNRNLTQLTTMNHECRPIVCNNNMVNSFIVNGVHVRSSKFLSSFSHTVIIIVINQQRNNM
jgi:hypothetical protein